MHHAPNTAQHAARRAARHTTSPIGFSQLQSVLHSRRGRGRLGEAATAALSLPLWCDVIGEARTWRLDVRRRSRSDEDECLVDACTLDNARAREAVQQGVKAPGQVAVGRVGDAVAVANMDVDDSAAAGREEAARLGWGAVLAHARILGQRVRCDDVAVLLNRERQAREVGVAQLLGLHAQTGPPSAMLDVERASRAI